MKRAMCPMMSRTIPNPDRVLDDQQPPTLFLPVECCREQCAWWSERNDRCVGIIE